MKYARIDIETIGFASKEDKTHINLGDHLQNIVIKDLYKMMGIKEDEIYVLNFNEISTYSGDYLILPINQAISHALNTFISPKIIPVFLGISRDTSAITQDEELYMKKRPSLTLIGLAQQLFISKSQAYKLRNHFFEAVADELGM